MKFFKSTLAIIVIFHTTLCLKASEGMWLPQLLKTLNESEMQSMGMKLSAEDIYSVNNGSLKDAIVHFGGFCTSELISSKGLLLTNHHCGYGSIQEHSSIDNNILRDGFWAKSNSEELPNPGLFATFIDRIEDVTSMALAGVNSTMNVSQRQSMIDQNLDALKKTYQLGKFQNVVIKPFFAGNQYFAFFTTTYNDVRLVGTPPEAIGKFGADTDNWVWPRHTGDFSLFRIYAGQNNEPADYSPNNQPYHPKHFLPISMDGIEEGDFTMIFGYPGRTDEYLPSQAVSQIMDDLDPAKIKVRDAALKIMDKYMRTDPSIKIKYASKYASLANYWKKWIGESQGLKKSNAVDKKKIFEAEFLKRAKSNPKYNKLLPQFEALYSGINESATVKDYFSEIAQRNIELFKLMFSFRKLVATADSNGGAVYDAAKNKMISSIESFYKDYDSTIDQEVAEALLSIYHNDVSSQYQPSMMINQNLKLLVQDIYENSSFTSFEKAKKILDLPSSQAIEAIKNDVAYNIVEDWMNVMNNSANPTYDKFRKQIDSCQMVYMKGQMDLFPEKKFYPDANSTMRVTYGKVEGFVPKDGMCYSPHTYLDGVMEKYIPGDYEFDVPAKLIDLFNKKDYGKYADASGKLPVCFLGSNHTTGGNSGSPAIDAYGNLIGLNFDRVWEGTMSDINFDPSICRNIMVDIRYVLWNIDKLAGASHLVDEMKLVCPKKK